MTGNLSFDAARLRVLGEENASSGIGTLSERAVHKMLKFYIEPNEELHEVSYLGSIADIMNGDIIYEIQTRAAERLAPKLEKFLSEKKVTVVFPVTVTKYLQNFDKRTGEISDPKKSPKRESVYTAFEHIYKIRRFLSSANLKIRLVLIESVEYKITDDRGRTHKSERIPTKLVEDLLFSMPSDFEKLLPDGLGVRFTSADFAKRAKIPKKSIFYVMKVLSLLGIVECTEKQGRTNIYKAKNC